MAAQNGHKQKWWVRLVEGNGSCLMGFQKDLYNKIVLCKTIPTGRLYTFFDNYIELYKFYAKEKDKTCHEVILGEYNQKMHFDIDMLNDPLNGETLLSGAAQNILDDLITSVKTIFSDKWNIQLSMQNDILIFTSHGKEKYSFHVIVNNYCHPSNEECKRIYDLVIEKMDPENAKYVDRAVYNSRQHFRMLWSHKENTDRYKTFCSEWRYKDETVLSSHSQNRVDSPEDDKNKISQMELLRLSLISETTDCKVLNSIAPKKEIQFVNDTLFDLQEITNVLNAYDDKHQVVKITNGLVVLKHTGIYKCKICDRDHENENPFLTVSKSGDLYFHCRRSGQKTKIGQVKIDYGSQNVETVFGGTNETLSKIEIPEFKYNIDPQLTNPNFLLEKIDRKKVVEEDKLRKIDKKNWIKNIKTVGLANL